MQQSPPADRQAGNSGAGEKGPMVGLLLQLFQLSLGPALHSSTDNHSLHCFVLLQGYKTHMSHTSLFGDMSQGCCLPVRVKSSDVTMFTFMKRHQAELLGYILNQIMQRVAVEAKN